MSMKTSSSQSPQIGANFRTHGEKVAKAAFDEVSIPSNRGKLPDKIWSKRRSNPPLSLNPLKSGQTSGLVTLPNAKLIALEVSIPSNRGKLPDFCSCPRCGRMRRSLNPLKSGQTSGRDLGRDLAHFHFQSQSPQIGANFRTLFLLIPRIGSE